MKEIMVNAESHASRIMINADISRLDDLTAGRKTVIVTDEKVQKLWGDQFPDFPRIVIPQGEENKTLATVEIIYAEMLRHNCDRKTLILAIGGGIVTDTAGFAASSFLRGLPFAFAPTTLLAQVDASVGGKNGVNFQSFKNLIGNFRQPEFVLCDLNLLSSLSQRDFCSGLAEIIKAALIADADFFSFLEENMDAILKQDKSALEEAVYQSLIIKAEVVAADEREAGLRRILNFGHTLAHGIEAASRKYTHGEAVALGMKAAVRISRERAALSLPEEQRVNSLIARAGLPLELEEDILEQAIEAISRDKKREGNDILFVLSPQLGRAYSEAISIEELRRILK